MIFGGATRMYSVTDLKSKVHPIIPSKFPPVSLFDWASSPEELEQIALLEGLTNERIQAELGSLNHVAKNDWILGPGATPLMAAFTHIGHSSRFSDGSFGVYYAANSLDAAIKETVYHRERFYSASKEPMCSLSMREYSTKILKPLVDIRPEQFIDLLHPEPDLYERSQVFGKKIREEDNWGLLYPSVRDNQSLCVAVFRPPALTIPVQGAHLRYIWNGQRISDVYVESRVKNIP